MVSAVSGGVERRRKCNAVFVFKGQWQLNYGNAKPFFHFLLNRRMKRTVLSIIMMAIFAWDLRKNILHDTSR